MPAKLCCAFGHVADGEGCGVIHKAHLQVQIQGSGYSVPPPPMPASAVLVSAKTSHWCWLCR